MVKVKQKELKLDTLEKVFKNNEFSDVYTHKVKYCGETNEYVSNGIFSFQKRFFDDYEVKTKTRSYSDVYTNVSDSVFEYTVRNPQSKEYYTCGISPEYNDISNKLIGKLKDYYIIQRHNLYFPIECKYYDFLVKNGFNLFVPERHSEIQCHSDLMRKSNTAERMYYNSGFYAVFHKSTSNPEYYIVGDECKGFVDGVIMSSHEIKLSVEELDEFVDNYLLNQPYEVQEDYLHAQCRLSFVNDKIEDLYMEKLVGKTGEVGEFLFMQLRTRMSEQEIREFYRENN